MASPLASLLPWIFSNLWSGLTFFFRVGLTRYLHIVKFVAVSIIIVLAFKVGIWVYNNLFSTVSDLLTSLNHAVPNGVSATAGFLAKANYCLPISEMFALLAVYITFCGLCLALKFLIASYKAIPFKFS